MGKVIGIDLGTTNCCVSVLEGGTVQIISNKEGGRTTPSVVGFTDKDERLVGQIAKRQAVTNAANTLFAVKRLIGRKFDAPEVEKMRTTVPFEIVKAPNGDAHISVLGRVYSPPEISAIVLQRLKLAAEEFLGDRVTEAIITVPAYFDDMQRQATRDAGKIAGLEVERIINEPTAAALAYGFGKNKNEKIAVYDLGGGTFDISILEINDGVFEVLSTSGNTFLGGEDFDHRIIDWMIESFQNEHGIDLRNDRLALQRLKEAAERAKCELSSVTETSVSLPFIAADATGPKHINATLTREKFEELVLDLVAQGEVTACRRRSHDARRISSRSFATRSQITRKQQGAPHDCGHLFVVGSGFQANRFGQAELNLVASLPFAGDLNIGTRLQQSVVATHVAAACASGPEARQRRHFNGLSIHVDLEPIA